MLFHLIEMLFKNKQNINSFKQKIFIFITPFEHICFSRETDAELIRNNNCYFIHFFFFFLELDESSYKLASTKRI